MNDSTDNGRLDADCWPELLSRGLRGLLAHVAERGVELLRQAVEQAVERSVASSRAPVVEPRAVSVAVVESAVATKPAAVVERAPRKSRKPREPRQLVRRPVESQLYRLKPLPHDLTPTQAEVIRQLDRHETPLIRTELCRLTGASGAAVNSAVMGLVRRKLVEMLDTGRIAFRLLPAAAATLDD